MNDQRREELDTSLRSELEQVARQEDFGPRDRVRWLGDRLDEYLDRWLSLCEASDATMDQLVNNVLFTAVEIGVDNLDKELQGSLLTVDGSWRRFVDSLHALRRGGSRQDASRLRQRFSEWRRTVVAST